MENGRAGSHHMNLKKDQNNDDNDKPGGGYGALGGATNLRATAAEREDKQIIVLKCHK